MGRRSFQAIATAVVMLVLVSCGGASSSGDNSLQRAQTKGLYPAFYGEDPYDFIDYNTGDYTGLEPEIVKYCAKQNGITQIFPVQQQWDALIPGLVAHRYDLIAAGMDINKKRELVATPTQGLYIAGSAAMVPIGNPLGIHSWTDIAAKHAVMGYITGGLEGTWGEGYGITVKGYDSLDAMVADLKAGRIQTIVTAELTLKTYLKKTHAAFEMATPWDYQGNLGTPGIYFNKSDVALREAFNNCITKMKQDGTFAALLDKWGFGASTMWPAGKPGHES